MTEFFELIIANPLEFMVSLGISSATIYSIIRIIKFIFSFFMRNRNKLKQAVERKKIASAVADELDFKNQIQDFKNYVDSKISEIINILDEMYKNPDCPNEIKAYIETLKNLEGNEEFAFFYEQNEEKYKNERLKKEKEIENNEQDLSICEQKTQNCEQKTQEDKQIICEQEKNKENNSLDSSDGEIDYA